MTHDRVLRVGIVGAGWIAEKAAITLNGLTNCQAYAIGSRSREKAEDFAARWNIARAYGSYADLIADAGVDLVYVATPHSHHYDVTRQALLAGNIIIDNINNPQRITVNGPDRAFVETIPVPQQITGYEYQFLACRQALIDGLLEPREMPHRETLYIMQLMDTLRQQWGIRYPMDE